MISTLTMPTSLAPAAAAAAGIRRRGPRGDCRSRSSTTVTCPAGHRSLLPTALGEEGQRRSRRPRQRGEAVVVVAAGFGDAISKCQPRKIAKELGMLGITSLAAASVILSPLSASAVSGGKGGGADRPLDGEDFSSQDLTNRDFTKARLRLTNFANANLQGISMFACFAEGSNFEAANLSYADLEQGNFTKANFKNANLTGAQVTAAVFSDADIEGSDWSDVYLRKDVQKQLCARAKGVNPVTGVDTKESLLCS